MNGLQRYYDILGLEAGASAAEIKQAYRTLAKTWHPDRFSEDLALRQQAEVKIKIINEAYAQLKASVGEKTTEAPVSIHKSANTAEIYFQEASIAAKAGCYEEAIAALDKAIQLNFSYAEAYRFRGFLYLQLGYEHRANSDLAKAAQFGLGNKAKSPPAAAPVPSPVSQWHCQHTLTGHTNFVSTIVLSADGKLLISGSWDSTIKLWNLNSNQSFCTWADHSDSVLALSLSANQQILVSSSKDETIKLWHIKTGTLLRSIRAGLVKSIAISPDGRTLVSGSWDNTVKLWDLRSLQLRHTLRHDAPVWTVAFTPDGKTLITGGEDHKIKLWHVASGELLRSQAGSTSLVLTATASPNGEVLAAGNQEGEVLLWQLQTGKHLRTLVGHTRSIRSIAFDAAGELLASGSDDHLLAVWRLSDAQQVGSLSHTAAVSAVAFSPDGRLFSGSFDRTLKIWEADAVSTGHLDNGNS